MAATKPISCTWLTLSPDASPQITGNAAATDATGTTTLIAPAAMPR